MHCGWDHRFIHPRGCRQWSVSYLGRLYLWQKLGRHQNWDDRPSNWILGLTWQIYCSILHASQMDPGNIAQATRWKDHPEETWPKDIICRKISWRLVRKALRKRKLERFKIGRKFEYQIKEWVTTYLGKI